MSLSWPRSPASAEIDASTSENAWISSRVERARDGDREAFGDLYRRYARLVHGILLARLPPRDVPDLVQEVFLLAMRKLSTLRNPSAFVPWLSTLARRAAADHYRSPERRTKPTDEEILEDPAPPGLTADGLAAFQALSRLPDAYRETLVLRLVEGMSGREIAAATGLTEGSVRVNLSRGMRRLRALLEGTEDD